MTYLSRADWGADPLPVNAGYPAPLEQFVGLVVHHTVIVMPDYDHDQLVGGDLDDICQYMRVLQHARPDLGDEVPYSFVMFEGATPGDVIVAEGRGFGRTGAHTINYNSTRYGCALAGDYTDHAPTPGQLAGIRWVGRQLADPTGAQATFGHRDVYATACPGEDAYPLLGEAQPPFNDPAPEEDMPLTADDLTAIANVIDAAYRPGADGHPLTRLAGDLAAVIAGHAATDPAAVAKLVLAGLSPQAIADAIDATLAKSVADELAKRLAS